MHPKNKLNIPHIKMPCWAFPLIMAVLCELLLYFWTTDTFVPGRAAAIFSFAVAFGGVLGFLCSMLPPKAGKWTAFAIGWVLVVLYIGEFLINDAFTNFMALRTVQAGAAGVMDTYLSVVFTAIIMSWWRILILLVPVIVFGVFVEPVKTRWTVRGNVAVAAVLMLLLAFRIVDVVGIDKAKMEDAYNFDSAVRAFGLNTALWLDAASDSQLAEKELEFEIVETELAVPQTEPAAEQTETEEPAVVYGEHTLGLDFAALAEAEKNPNIKALHSYIASQKPASENAYTGLFEGKNLIFITAEALTGAVIDPELTPTLYRLATEGIEFTDYYQPMWAAGTTGGEYTNLVGQIPVNGGCMSEVFEQNLFLTIGNQLQEAGYSSAAYHNNTYTFYDRHKTHTHLGYDYFMGYGNGLEKGINGKNWPQSDVELIDYTVPMYIDKQPFSIYYMSVSGHSNYDVQTNSMCAKNYDKVAHLDYSEPVKCYIAANLELEYALESLLKHLEEADLMDDTVIVIAPDHYPYGLANSSTWKLDTDCLTELYGAPPTDFVRDKTALIIWSGAIEGMDLVVDTPTYSLDILPTLSNLFGVPYDSRLHAGRDVLSGAAPLVIWGVSGSWMTEKGGYLAETGEFIPAEGVQVDDAYVENMHTVVRNKMKYSKGTAQHNYFKIIEGILQKTEE